MARLPSLMGSSCTNIPRIQSRLCLGRLRPQPQHSRPLPIPLFPPPSETAAPELGQLAGDRIPIRLFQRWGPSGGWPWGWGVSSEGGDGDGKRGTPWGGMSAPAFAALPHLARRGALGGSNAAARSSHHPASLAAGAREETAHLVAEGDQRCPPCFPMGAENWAGVPQAEAR